MGIPDKVIAALRKAIKEPYIHLDVDDGISGFVVSAQFKDMSTIDRQGLIENALNKSDTPFTAAERREVLMIAALTPDEYDAVGVRIRVQKIKETAAGAVEIVVQGRLADAEYVRGLFRLQKGVQTTEPKYVAGAEGVLMSFRGKGSQANPLSKEKALRILRADQYVEVVKDA